MGLYFYNPRGMARPGEGDGCTASRTWPTVRTAALPRARVLPAGERRGTPQEADDPRDERDRAAPHLRGLPLRALGAWRGLHVREVPHRHRRPRRGLRQRGGGPRGAEGGGHAKTRAVSLGGA